MEKKHSDNEPNFFAIIFVLFLIISIIVIAVLYLKKGGNIKNILDRDEQKNTEEVQLNKTYTLNIITDANKKVEYTLKQGGELVVKNEIIPNINEKYTIAEYNKTYLLEIMSSSDYYYNSKKCKVLKDTDCIINLKKKGNISLTFTNSKLYFNIKDGLIQEPIVCTAWKFDIYVVKITDLKRYEIPKRLKHLVDICYKMNGDISTNQVYNIEIERVNPKLSNVTFYIIDKEVNEENILTYNSNAGIKDIILEVEI